MKMCSAVLLAGLIILLTTGAWAQDSQYWTNQYGTRSAFLGGAVVGGVRDTSAGYYNPGALGFLDNPSLSVSADAFRLTDLHMTEGVGGADRLDSEEVEVLPLLLSGVFKPQGLSDRHMLGYSFLSRNNHMMRVSARREATSDVLTNPTAPGDEDFIGQFTREDRLLEVWGGLSYAYRLSEHLSLGVTNFLAIRSQAISKATFARAINRDLGVTATTDATFNIDYWNLRLLWKAGAAADYGRWKLGLTVTTPSINLAGSGTVAADFTVTDVDIDGDGVPETFVADDRQEELETTFRSPLAIAAGVEYGLTESTRLAFSAEWFAREDRFSVMTPESKEFIRSVGGFQAVDSRDFLRVTYEATDVFNFGAGIEHIFTDWFTGYLSFRTDYHHLPNERGDGLPLGFTAWDLYHTALGANLKGEHSDFGIGVVYSYGKQKDFPQLESFENPEEQGFLTGELGVVEARYQAITFILGATYYFR